MRLQFLNRQDFIMAIEKHAPSIGMVTDDPNLHCEIELRPIRLAIDP
jgi:hypothetical protein